jgi:hypothetical protein
MAIRSGGVTPGNKKKALETLNTKPVELGVSGGKSIAGAVVKTIIKDAPAVIRGVRKTIAATRKVSSADAKLVAAKTVGKRPTGSQLKFKQVATSLSKREKAEVKVKAPVKVIKSAAGAKTPGQIAVERSNVAAAKRADLQKKLQPPKRVVTKAKPGPGPKAAENKAATDKLRADIKDNPNSRAAQDQKAYAQREARDTQAAREGQEAETSARKQWADSQRSPKTVQNPVNERGTVAKVEERAATGIKESNIAEKKRIVTKAPPKSNALGGQHMGGHSDLGDGNNWSSGFGKPYYQPKGK